jgi:hypothetical protein
MLKHFRCFLAYAKKNWNILKKKKAYAYRFRSIFVFFHLKLKNWCTGDESTTDLRVLKYKERA